MVKDMITMKSIYSKRLSLFLTIVLLIVMTACARSVSKEESSEVGSSYQIEEVQPMQTRLKGVGHVHGTRHGGHH